MNTSIPSRLLLLAIPLLLGACASAPRSYLDPGQPRLAYEALARPGVPLKMVVTAEFRRDGVHLPAADPALRQAVESTLRASGVIVPAGSTDGAEGRVGVVVDNVVGSLGDAVGKGIVQGLTFGAVGSTVADRYELTMTLAARGRTWATPVVRHAIYTASGNTSTPDGVETVPVDVAFQRVVEQMLLRALKQAQASGAITAADASVGRRN